MIWQREDGTWVDPIRELVGRPPPSKLPRQIKPQCADSPTGKHEAQHYTISHTFVYQKDDWLIEVHCKHCGQMGTIRINPLSTKWCNKCP